MEKKEAIKEIDRLIEKILEDIIEVCNIMTTKEGSDLEEMCRMFSAKRRTADLTESFLKIYELLVKLKYSNSRVVEKEDVNVECKKLFERGYD